MDAEWDFHISSTLANQSDRSQTFSQTVDSVVLSSEFEKIPMPVLLSDLANLPPSEEKIYYGQYGFGMIRVCGQIANMMEGEGGELKYELSDPQDKNVGDFTLHGIIYQQSRKGHYAVGQWVVVYGKLHSLYGAMSLLTFAANPTETSAEIRALKAEARLAKFYYVDNGPEKIMNGTVVEYAGGPLSNEPLQRSVKAEPTGGFKVGGFNGQNSYVNPTPLTSIQPTAFGVKPESNHRGLTGVKRAIVEYLEQHNSDANTGTHVEDLKRHTGNPPNFQQEVEHLVSEGIIYNTIDEHHYTLI